MHRLVSALLAAVVLALPVAAQRIYFGVYEPGAYMAGNGSVLLGYAEAGGFVRQPYSEVLRPYRAGSAAVGFAPSGERVRFRIDSVVVPQGDLYDGLLELSPTSGFQQPDSLELFPVLLVSEPEQLHVLPTATVALAPAVAARLEREAQVLFRDALRERDPDERNARLKLEQPTVLKVQGVPDLLVARFPAEVLWPGAGRVDDRASVFFIYSEQAQKTIYARFGHAEWSPAADSPVLTVRPWLFFRLGTSDTPYFFGEHWCGWECNGFAIAELRTGRAVLESF